MITSIYPVLMSEDVAATDGVLPRRVRARDRRSSPTGTCPCAPAPSSSRCSTSTHETIPAGHRTPAGGVLVNIEVEDVDAEYERLVTRGGAPVALDLRSETFGQRHVILVAPGGVLVDVIQPIPVTGDF